MNALLNHMNTEQSEAVQDNRRTIVNYGRCWFREDRVLTHRIAYLLDEKDVRQCDVLAITFTNKAPNERTCSKISR